MTERVMDLYKVMKQIRDLSAKIRDERREATKAEVWTIFSWSNLAVREEERINAIAAK